MESTEFRNTDELLRLYSIDEKDIANVRKVGENIVPQLEELVSLFYSWLETQPEFDEFFSDEETLTRIKSESLRYWQQFFENEMNDAYIAQRQKIGKTHARIGLPLPIYFAAMNRMLLIFREALSNGKVDPEEAKARMDSVTKLNYFDSGLVVETYSQMVSDRIAASSRSLMEMSTPVTQIWHGVLFLPIVGLIDSRRAQDIMDAVLTKISETRAGAFIMDISGVGVVDTAVANYLIKVTKATRLMGCESTISGVSPAIAQTIVDLGIDVGSVRTTATMQDALSEAFRLVARLGGEKRKSKPRTSATWEESAAR
jgi:rsbT co-antagonist protein RsbR